MVALRTLEEEHVDYSEYEDFDDAQRQVQHWLEVTVLTPINWTQG